MCILVTNERDCGEPAEQDHTLEFMRKTVVSYLNGSQLYSAINNRLN